MATRFNPLDPLGLFERKTSNPETKQERYWLPNYIRDKARELRGYLLGIEDLHRKIEALHKDVAATAAMFDPVKEMADRRVWERRAKNLYVALTELGNARLEILTVVGDLEISR